MEYGYHSGMEEFGMALSRKAREILNREDLVQQRDLWFQRLQNLFSSQPDDWNDRYLFSLDGIVAHCDVDPYTEPEHWMEACLENLAARYEVLEDKTSFRPLCVEYSNYGVHYIDKMLGANVYFNGGQWYNDYLTSPIGTLQAPDLDRNEIWTGTRRAIEAFLEADVAVPLFGLPTIASALNIAVNLYGEKILMEMVLDPENASKDLETINELLCEIHRRCRSMIPMQQLQPVISWARTQPPGYGQLCGCTTHLISGECYEELIAPLDDKLLSVYPNGGMIHLCGCHTQHIEAFRSMKSLKAIQINDRASDDLAIYYNQLRDDQMIYLNISDNMSLEKAMSITNGNRLVLNGRPPQPVPKK